MAFFKFRLPNPGAGEDGSSGGNSGESLEALRRRARQRLIGATVLVVLAVIGFPILFDTQPRPVSVDIPIDIPDKHKTSPQTAPAAIKPAAEAAPALAKADAVTTQSSLEHNEEVVTPTSPAAKSPAPAVAETSATKADGPVKSTASDKPASDKPAEAATARFVVQVGAYAEDAKAREVRARLEKAGLKTYTHVAETKDGKRTRVRLGPFATKEEAEKAAARAKTMNLQATILTL